MTFHISFTFFPTIRERKLQFTVRFGAQKATLTIGHWVRGWCIRFFIITIRFSVHTGHEYLFERLPFHVVALMELVDIHAQDTTKVHNLICRRNDSHCKSRNNRSDAEDHHHGNCRLVNIFLEWNETDGSDDCGDCYLWIFRFHGGICTELIGHRSFRAILFSHVAYAKEMTGYKASNKMVIIN